jgi:hypothetical protein
VKETAHFSLEDSWVLGFAVTPTEFAVRIQFALLETHPEYRQPRPGDMYWYREGLLSFSNFSSLGWRASGAKPALGPQGEIDYGSVDSLVTASDGYALEGDFGVVTIGGASLTVSLDPEEGHLGS